MLLKPQTLYHQAKSSRKDVLWRILFLESNEKDFFKNDNLHSYLYFTIDLTSLLDKQDFML